MDGGFAEETVGGTVQRRDPPLRHFLHVDVEGGFVELDHIDADVSQLVGLVVEQCGKRHGQGGLVAVVGIGNRVDDGHRSG